MDPGAARYSAKREAGLSAVRADGSRYSAETDRIAYEAEAWAARLFGCVPDDRVYTDRGDDGFDFLLSVDVKHLGIDLATGRARRNGHLILNPSSRIAEMIIVTAGMPPDEPFQIIGWITGRRFVAERQLVDFGYGKKWALPVARLNRFVGPAE